MGFFSHIFSSDKNKSVLGVDIGSSSLKVVQLRKEHGIIVLETYGELALGPYANVAVGQATNLPADTIAKTLTDLLREASITTADSGISIPSVRSLLVFVELPYRENADEQRTIIELEARKYIPVPIEEVQLNWFILPGGKALEQQADSPRTVQVLLVAVHKDEITLLENVAQNAGLSASFFEIEIFSTIRAVVDEPVKPIMIIDIGSAYTKMYVVEQNVVGSSHSISHGGEDVTRAIATIKHVKTEQAELIKKSGGFDDTKDTLMHTVLENVYSEIFTEAKRVLTQFETTYNRAVSTVILTGGGGVAKGLVQYAKTFFAVDTRVADPFAKTKAPEFMRSTLKEIGPEFSVAVGLALRKLED